MLEATSCAEAVEVLRGQAVDVLVLDGSLPDGSGLDVLVGKPAALHVVLYSGTAVGRLPAGVDVVVPKGGPPDALLEHLATL